MAHFVKPLKATDSYKQKSDGSLSSMTIKGAGTKGTVVLWGGGRGGEILKLVALDSSGCVLANTHFVKWERGHDPDPDDDQWYGLWEVEPLADGCGTLTAVDKSGMPFARIALTVGSGGKRALIMIPSQGTDLIAFQSVAWSLTKDAYAGQATTIKSKISAGRQFYFMTNDKKPTPYPIGAQSNLSTIIIIAHSASDGPNLAYKDPDPALSLDDHQPLQLDASEQSANARAFWAAAGHALNGAGKLILLGCDGIFFAPKIAPVVGRRIYALQGQTLAGGDDYSVRHVKAVEKGAAIPPMKQFNP